MKREIERAGGECLKIPPIFYRGIPDRLVLMPGGQLVFVELKAPDRRPTLTQAKVHERLRRLGFRVEVLDGIEAVDGFMLTL